MFGNRRPVKYLSGLLATENNMLNILQEKFPEFQPERRYIVELPNKLRLSSTRQLLRLGAGTRNSFHDKQKVQGGRRRMSPTV